ncbi:FAD-dependent oxidoreductase [Streptomyces sp. NPDC057681]|uniref:FAD-dependent oxidoreductase n=1 Tax=unclassified Streptomyces TaxID=2593676 RepID=UPI0036A50800
MAYHLARRGILVTLLEQGPAPATGVTGESFAWISSSGNDRPGGFVHANRQPMSTTSGGATAPPGIRTLSEPLAAVRSGGWHVPALR